MKFPIIRQTIKHPLVEETVVNAKKYIEEHKDDPNVHFMHFCPYCGAPLIATNRVEKLETLSEHVSCSEPTPKTVYKCSAHCGLSETSKWDWEGGMYLDFPEGLNKDEWECLYKLHQNVQNTCFGAKYNKFPCEALGSFAYKNTMEVYTPLKKKEFPIRFFKNQKHVPVIERNYEFDNFGKALSVNYHINYRLYKNENNLLSYTLCNPWIKQISDCLKYTKYAYQDWLKYPNTQNLNKIYGINRWYKTADDRKGFEKIYYKYVIPFVFGKIMGIKNAK